MNELLAGLRRAQISSEPREIASTNAAPSLPPTIRSILNIPDTPVPQPRRRQRTDAAGGRLPAGPAPPRSWLENSGYAGRASLGGLQTSIYAPKARTGSERLFPESLDHLPGISRISGLVGLCLKKMAMNWEFHRVYDQHYLASLPTPLREALLSFLAVYGPEEGIGYDELSVILSPPNDQEMESEFAGNDDFQRLDLSGSIGRSITFKQLQTILTPPAGPEEVGESWEESMLSPKSSLIAKIPTLTQLSLSHPPESISWTKLLSIAKHIPTLTHLSLAYWPTPCLTPNSKTAKMSSGHGSTVSYGGTNFYSHSLDNDWSEATSILRRLSKLLYNLVYIDLDGCTAWAPALRFIQPASSGIDWVKNWGKVREIQLHSKYEFDEAQITNREQLAWKRAILEALETEKWIRRRRGWIVVKSDDWERWDTLSQLPAMPEKAFWDARRDNAQTGWLPDEDELWNGSVSTAAMAWD